MSVELYPDFFNDVFGPVMQPGSSSHTAAPCRLGYVAHSLLDEAPVEIRVVLDQEGSFAGTFGTMYEDNAMLAGAMGMLPDDIRLFEADRLATQAGITYGFEFDRVPESAHPNAIKFVLTGASGRTVTLVGDSTGGGMIETRVVDGFPLRVKGDTYVVLVFDPAQSLDVARWAELVGNLPALVEVGAQGLGDRGVLHFCKTAEAPDLAALRAQLPGLRMALLEPVLPVITRPERQPQLFQTMTRWRELVRERQVPLWEVAVQYQVDAAGWTREQVIAYMRRIELKMRRQTHAVYEEDLDVPESPFKRDMAAQWAAYASTPGRLTDDVTAQALKWAYGAGAGVPGVEVVAGPMGSGGGYIHAALCAVQEARGFDDNDLLRGLFIAAGVGALAFTRTEPTGERIGCTGECGVCGAMAAAGVAEMAGGTPEQVENAASLSLQSAIGIPCDPIAGGLGQPCRSRITAAVCTAIVFADLALAGRDAVLPLHEVLDVADAVGRQLPPELLCTSRGGCSVAPAAQRQAAAYREWFEQSQKEQAVRPPGNLI